MRNHQGSSFKTPEFAKELGILSWGSPPAGKELFVEEVRGASSAALRTTLPLIPQVGKGSSSLDCSPAVHLCLWGLKQELLVTAQKTLKRKVPAREGHGEKAHKEIKCATL